MSVLDAIWLFAGLAVVCKLIERWQYLSAEHKRMKRNEYIQAKHALEQQKAYCKAAEEAKARGESFPYGFGLSAAFGMGAPRPRKRDVPLLEYKPRR